MSIGLKIFLADKVVIYYIYHCMELYNVYSCGDAKTILI